MKKLVKYLSILLNGFAKKESQHQKDIEATDMEGLIEELQEKNAIEEDE